MFSIMWATRSCQSEQQGGPLQAAARPWSPQHLEAPLHSLLWGSWQRRVMEVMGLGFNSRGFV